MAEFPDNHRISSGSAFEERAGYSRAVIRNGWVFVAGTTGMNYAEGTIEDDVVAQAEQTFANIKWALDRCGCPMHGVVRVQYTLTDAAYFEPCMPIMKKWLGAAAPAATAVIAGLVDPRMKIAVEVTARLPDEHLPADDPHKPNLRV